MCSGVQRPSAHMARTSAGWFHTAIFGPTTVYTCPVTCLARSLNRKTTMGATSSGSPISDSSVGTLADMRVRATGTIALAVMP